MRYDYGLYIVALICFVLAALIFMGYAQYAPAYLTTGTEAMDLVTMMFSAILGLVFVGLGYGVRPKKVMPPPEVPPSAPSVPPKPVTTKPKKTAEKKVEKKAVRKRRPKKKT